MPKKQVFQKKEKLKIIKDQDIDTGDYELEMKIDQRAMDTFDNRKLSTNKDEGFQPSTYSLKLQEKINTAKNDRRMISPGMNKNLKFIMRDQSRPLSDHSDNESQDSDINICKKIRLDKLNESSSDEEGGGEVIELKSE